MLRLLFIFISILSVCNGSMSCMFQKYPECWVDTTGETPNAYCANSERKLKCFEENAKLCGVFNETIIQNLITDYVDICDNGSKLHEVYKKHEECVTLLYLSARDPGGPCLEELSSIVEDPDIEKDNTKWLKSVCKLSAVSYACACNQVRERCGEEGVYVLCKLFGPTQKIQDGFCVELGATVSDVEQECVLNRAKAIGSGWMSRLWQIGVVLFSFKMLNI